MRELPWLLAFVLIMTVGAVVVTLAQDSWPTSAQLSFAVTYFGLAYAVLFLGRERTRRPQG